jgi:hypothetical protein
MTEESRENANALIQNGKPSNKTNLLNDGETKEYSYEVHKPK